MDRNMGHMTFSDDLHPVAMEHYIRGMGLVDLVDHVCDDLDNAYDISSFMKHPAIVKLAVQLGGLEAIRGRVPGTEHFTESNATLFISLVWLWAMWKRSYSPVYTVANKLSGIIEGSSDILSKILCEDFILPHKALYLRLPSDKWWLENMVTGVHNVLGIYMIDATCPEGVINTKDNGCIFVGDSDKDVPRERILYCVITAGRGSLATDENDDQVFKAPIRMEPGRSLSDMVQEAHTFSTESHMYGRDDVASMSTFAEVLPYAVGAMVYATSANADLSIRAAKEYTTTKRYVERLRRKNAKAAKVKRAEKRLGDIVTRRYIDLGANVSIPGSGTPWAGARFVCSHEQTYWVKKENVPIGIAGERKYVNTKVNENGTKLYKIRRYKVGGWYGIKDDVEPARRLHILG